MCRQSCSVSRRDCRTLCYEIVVCVATVAIEDDKQLRRSVAGCEAVRGHCVELGRLAGAQDEVPGAESEGDGAGEHVAPVASRVDAELTGCGLWFDADLEGNDPAPGSGERPDRAAVGAGGNGPDDHVVVRGGVDEGADVDLQGLGEALEQVEAEVSLAGLDA